MNHPIPIQLIKVTRSRFQLWESYLGKLSPQQWKKTRSSRLMEKSLSTGGNKRTDLYESTPLQRNTVRRIHWPKRRFIQRLKEPIVKLSSIESSDLINSIVIVMTGKHIGAQSFEFKEFLEPENIWFPNSASWQTVQSLGNSSPLQWRAVHKWIRWKLAKPNSPNRWNYHNRWQKYGSRFGKSTKADRDKLDCQVVRNSVNKVLPIETSGSRSPRATMFIFGSGWLLARISLARSGAFKNQNKELRTPYVLFHSRWKGRKNRRNFLQGNPAWGIPGVSVCRNRILSNSGAVIKKVYLSKQAFTMRALNSLKIGTFGWGSEKRECFRTSKTANVHTQTFKQYFQQDWRLFEWREENSWKYN